jgi:hypothetical protein
MKKTTLLAAAIAGLSFSGTSMAEVFAFIEMPLTPSQEAVSEPAPVPAPDSNGYGRMTAFYDDETKVFTYHVSWKLRDDAVPITQDAGNNHIHGPADLGTAAGIVLALPDLEAVNAGTASGSVTLTAEQAEAMEAELAAGRLYYNIHSTIYSGGELRGQLVSNAANPIDAVYQDAQIRFSNILVPGIDGPQVYDAQLNLVNGTFALTTATPVR